MSELKDICCDLEHSKKLKGVGFSQDSLFYLEIRRSSITNKYDHYVIEPKDNLTPSVYKNFASPTAGEIINKLPLHFGYYEFELQISVNNQNEFVICYSKIDENGDQEYFYCHGCVIQIDKILHHALCNMYCFLAENKLLNGG